MATAIRCHYEVLEVERDADDDVLKKAYRKLALKWHPDKNAHQADLATERFKDIQGAYAVLSDPQERAWYDAHRDAILRGGSGVAADGGGADADMQPGVDVWAYFTSSAYTGFGDDTRGFYTVYAGVFQKIATDEVRFGERAAGPPLGSSSAPWVDVRDFYGWWDGFSTARPCAGADTYDTRQAPNRQVRRAMEKENNKARSEKRKELNELVRNLVAYVKKRDRRVAEHAEKVEKEKAEKTARVAAEKEARRVAYESERARLKEEQLASRDEAAEAEAAAEIDALAREFDDDEFGGGGGRRKGKKGKKGKGGGGGGESESAHAAVEEAAEAEAAPSAAGASGEAVAAAEAAAVEEDREAEEEEVFYFEEEDGSLFCVACNKRFKNVAQWHNHERSRKHAERVQALRAELQAEEEVAAAAAEAEGEEESDDEGEGEAEESEAEAEEDGAGSDATDDDDDDDDDDEEDEEAMLLRMAGQRRAPRAVHESPRASAEVGVPDDDDDDDTDEAAGAGAADAGGGAASDAGSAEGAGAAPPAADADIVEAVAGGVAIDGATEGEEEGEESGGGADAPAAAAAATAGAPTTAPLRGAKAKKAARKAKAVAKGAHFAPAKMSDTMCALCGLECGTRNQLFKHINSSGHKAPNKAR